MTDLFATPAVILMTLWLSGSVLYFQPRYVVLPVILLCVMALSRTERVVVASATVMLTASATGVAGLFI